MKRRDKIFSRYDRISVHVLKISNGQLETYLAALVPPRRRKRLIDGQGWLKLFDAKFAKERIYRRILLQTGCSIMKRIVNLDMQFCRIIRLLSSFHSIG